MKKVDPLDELRNMYGTESIVEQIERIVDIIEMIIYREKEGLICEPLNLNTLLIGPPGTGKTTVARIMGKLFYHYRLLTGDRFTEICGNDLIAEYVGQTAIKVKKILEEAKGGVLLIEEAYAITSYSHFGEVAIDSMLTYLSEHNDELAVFFAGYPDEMQELLKQNPGLKSAIPNVIEFADCRIEELVQIAHVIAKRDNYIIEDEAEEIIFKKLEKYKEDCAKGQFRNAGEVDNLIQNAREIQSARLLKSKKDKDDLSREELMTLTREDFEKAEICIQSSI